MQTISVPPGGAAAVDFKVEVQGDFLVDHALSRAMRGLVGTLTVEGPEQPEIFREGVDEKIGMVAEQRRNGGPVTSRGNRPWLD